MSDEQPNTPPDEAVGTTGDGAEDALDDDERTVRRLLEGASSPIGDVERAAAGLKHKHLHEGTDGDFAGPSPDA